MRRLMLVMILTILTVTGCGSISPQSLLIKGAMWAGEQGVKKVIKDRREHKKAASTSQPHKHGD